MTTASDVAVVATQVARTDRRALSEAWYSALHVHGATSPAAGASRSHVLAAASSVVRPAKVREGSSPLHATASRGNERVERAERNSPPLERRLSTTDASRRVEGAVAGLARTAPSRRSSTLVIGGSRVRVLVRTDGDATRIVALCSEPLRVTVERALAHVRYALARAGARAG